MRRRFLSERVERAELMDDFTAGGATLRQAHRQLRCLNRLFGAASPALYGVQRLWRECGSPRRLHLLDIGAGSGDVNRRMLRWAAANGVKLRITLVDKAEEACAEARAYYAAEPQVDVRRSDLFELSAGCADIVTASQFAHHFANEELPTVVERMLTAARLGIVVNDIHRHPAAWAAVWLASRLSANRYIRHDAPLSVAKGFRGADWELLGERLEGVGAVLQYRWRPLFRYAVLVRRAPEGG
jgi:2-polyprenyl-3-methyl-5-hydroxy-6-metoxy-1,4-benzoquinol methylase